MELKDITELLKVVSDAPSSYVVLVLLIALAHVIAKTTKLVISHIVQREVKFGELKAIAVAHKAANEDISPEQAVREINLSIGDD